jgi:hypothetical protein
MSTTEAKTTALPIDAAFEQVKDLNDEFLTAARKAGNLYVDYYEKAVDRAVDLELKLAGATQQEWLKNMIEAQAEITRELKTSYVAAARDLLK